jgi:hypothetical protein
MLAKSPALRSSSLINFFENSSKAVAPITNVRGMGIFLLDKVHNDSAFPPNLSGGFTFESGKEYLKFLII